MKPENNITQGYLQTCKVQSIQPKTNKDYAPVPAFKNPGADENVGVPRFRLAHRTIGVAMLAGGPKRELYVLLGSSHSNLERRKTSNLHPQALHNVFGPLGPFRHSGESDVPQSVHWYFPFNRFLLSPSSMCRAC